MLLKAGESAGGSAVSTGERVTLTDTGPTLDAVAPSRTSGLTAAAQPPARTPRTSARSPAATR